MNTPRAEPARQDQLVEQVIKDAALTAYRDARVVNLHQHVRVLRVTMCRTGRVGAETAPKLEARILAVTQVSLL